MEKSSLVIGIIKEVISTETRVAATPKTVKSMTKNGFKVIVEAGAGSGSYTSDKEYEQAGAKIGEVYNSADIVLGINTPQIHPKTSKHQIDMLKDGACWISMLVPDLELETINLHQI